MHCFQSYQRMIAHTVFSYQGPTLGIKGLGGYLGIFRLKSKAYAVAKFLVLNNFDVFDVLLTHES